MNILYLHCHDAGRYLSPYGYAVPTPALADFARHALPARNAHCAAPTCSASRSALLTGQTPHQAGMNGLVHRGFSLAHPERHLARFLQNHGYETVLIGIQHEWMGPAPLYSTLLEPESPVDEPGPVSDLAHGRAAGATVAPRE